MDVIAVEDVTKTYRTGVGRARVREMLPRPLDTVVQRAFPRWWSKDTFNALEDVSIRVPRGASVGLVGHNGAGKTTLLKVIAGVTAPNAGTVSVGGRIAALIDVVVGFHPELTGRENVYLLAAMYGVSRKAIAPRVDRIFEFAEVDAFLDTPLKRYSAGMAGRLAFAVMTELDPDALLIDEVLGVGDSKFQRKCAEWLETYRAGGGSLLFVSHNLALVRNMTERLVWLDQGRVVDEGPTGDVLSRYSTALERRDSRPGVRDPRGEAFKMMRQAGLDRWGTGGARVEAVDVGEPSPEGELRVIIRYESQEPVPAVFCVGFCDDAGREIGASTSPVVKLAAGRGRIRCDIRPLPLRSGVYFPVVAILSDEGVVRDRWKLDRPVVVDGNGGGIREAFGAVAMGGAWGATNGDATPRRHVPAASKSEHRDA